LRHQQNQRVRAKKQSGSSLRVPFGVPNGGSSPGLESAHDSPPPLATHRHQRPEQRAGIVADDWSLDDSRGQSYARIYKVRGGPNDAAWFWSVLFAGCAQSHPPMNTLLPSISNLTIRSLLRSAKQKCAGSDETRLARYCINSDTLRCVRREMVPITIRRGKTYGAFRCGNRECQVRLALVEIPHHLSQEEIKVIFDDLEGKWVQCPICKHLTEVLSRELIAYAR
jgi:hypothetical protein